MSKADETDDLEATTVAAKGARPSGPHALQLRLQHQAIFDATLKEIFLAEQVQLGEPIAQTGIHSAVYSGYYGGDEVAVKILILASETLRDGIGTYGSFKVECEKAMVLSRYHESILRILEYGDAMVPEQMPSELKSFFPLDVVPFMIMEKAQFGSLDRVVREQRGRPGFGLLDLLAGVADATDGIKAAHQHHVAHRDIKPQNILIHGPRRGKITDFGIARWRRRYRDQDIVELTPKYCSPEQAFFALTKRSGRDIGISGDIYSWAIMVYELVTGWHPFHWAMKRNLGHKMSQRAILQAIAANDRRGFRPTGDITFDALMTECTRPFKLRIEDIAKANAILRQFTHRHGSR